jgi:hypothetical protein
MYQLFMAGAKLLGIYLVISGLTEAAMLTSASGSLYMQQLAIACCLHFMIGTFLALGTRFVARAVRIHEEFDGETPTISYRSGLEVGILLIGLLSFMNALPPAVGRWIDFSQMIVRTRELSELFNMQTLALLGSVLMLVFAHRIAALLERVNRRPSGPDST